MNTDWRPLRRDGIEQARRQLATRDYLIVYILLDENSVVLDGAHRRAAAKAAARDGGGTP